MCQDISRAGQKIKVTREKRKFRKTYTILTGFDAGTDMKALAKDLKNKFACGGTMKEGRIELQGDHISKMKKVLTDMNYTAEQLDIVER